MSSQDTANTLTALNHECDQIDGRVAKLKAEGKYPLSRNRLIEELKTNTELRQAVRDVLLEVPA
jgi:hypothetical protein